MAIQTVAVMSPGDMGHAIGRTLRDNGLRVITCLRGRSARTAALAEAAGFDDVGDDHALVHESDAVLSVLPPAAAMGLAERVATAIEETGTSVLYVDCNAVAPQTARAIGDVVTRAGGRFVDAGIIGGPPRPGASGPRIYACGEHAGAFAELAPFGLDVRVIGAEIGRASGLKMCYAALTKGLTALATELLVAGRALGISDDLMAELRSSQSALLGSLERSIPGMPPKAYRWVGEMEEIAATFDALGLTPKIHQGAADLYRFVGETPLGAETPESRSQGQSLDEVVAILAAALRV